MATGDVKSENGPWYCPRCDRVKPDLEKLKEHVAARHPNHDPLWYETYPEEKK